MKCLPGEIGAGSRVRENETVVGDLHLSGGGELRNTGGAIKGSTPRRE